MTATVVVPVGRTVAFLLFRTSFFQVFLVGIFVFFYFVSTGCSRSLSMSGVIFVHLSFLPSFIIRIGSETTATTTTITRSIGRGDDIGCDG